MGAKGAGITGMRGVGPDAHAVPITPFNKDVAKVAPPVSIPMRSHYPSATSTAAQKVDVGHGSVTVKLALDQGLIAKNTKVEQGKGALRTRFGVDHRGDPLWRPHNDGARR